jgi:hypothetical protein
MCSTSNQFYLKEVNNALTGITELFFDNVVVNLRIPFSWANINFK